jgi:hypothetical protein
MASKVVKADSNQQVNGASLPELAISLQVCNRKMISTMKKENVLLMSKLNKKKEGGDYLIKLRKKRTSRGKRK